MRRWLAAIFVLIGVLGLAPGPASAAEAASQGAEDARGRARLDTRLASIPGASGGQVIPVRDEAVTRAFPGSLFYVLRFRQYPVAREVPAPLRPNNLFVVNPSGGVEMLQETGELETFFRAALAPVTTEAGARQAARAWLRLAQEFLQDGFFRFSIPEETITVVRMADGGQRVTGQAIVGPQGGNRGAVVATLTFDASGGLAGASQTAGLKSGVRPICQATRLLDPDPLVRAAAEEALLAMGRAAGDYLAEQRAGADPELREAIDRLWTRILAGSR